MQTRSSYHYHQNFNHPSRIWNTLAIIDLNDHPLRIKNNLLEYLEKQLLSNFDQCNHHVQHILVLAS